MSAQHKRYLQLAEQASEPRSKLFYRLMAEVAPLVNGMARQNVNQVGASIVYDIVLRVAAGLLVETAYNLSSTGTIDTERLGADFRKALEHVVGMQDTLGAVPCTPKMDA